MNQEQIGKFIAKSRKEKNLTQEQLAELLNVNVKSVSRWENGNTMPDLSLIPLLAKEINVEVSELLNGRKMTKEELVDLRDNLNYIIDYSNCENKTKALKLNILFTTGLLFIIFGTINSQFNILSEIIKNDHICQGIVGAIYGLGIGFEFIAFYYNNRNISFKEQSENTKKLTKKK